MTRTHETSAHICTHLPPSCGTRVRGEQSAEDTEQSSPEVFMRGRICLVEFYIHFLLSCTFI